MTDSMQARSTIALIVGMATVGALLRCHDIASQLLISDEWHGLFAASQFSYGELSRMFTIGATSPPMNLLQRALFEYAGWSEIVLRLPGLLAGIALLVLAPCLLRRVVGARVLVIYVGLLATSPALVYYSRYVRPYSLAVLLGFSAFLFALHFARSGRAGFAWGFVAAAVPVVYLHLLEVRIGLLCLIGLWLLRWPTLARRFGRPRAGRSSRRVLAMVSVAFVGSAAVVFFLGVLGGESGLVGVMQRAPLRVATLFHALGLIYGVSSSIGLLFLVALTCLGFVERFREDPLLAAFAGVVVAGSASVVLVASPDGAHLPEILARYLIPVMPIVLLLLAAGIVSLFSIASRSGLGTRVPEGIWISAGLVVPLAMLALGPLPHDVLGTNQFTNHKAYQHSYDIDRSVAERFARYRARSTGGEPRTLPIPDFYRKLAEDPAARTIIEYPVWIGDKFVPYPAYQEVHGKRVLGGYRSKGGAANVIPRRGFLFASDSLDDFARTVGAKSLAGLRNYVDLDDPGAFRRAGVDYIVVHFDLEREVAAQEASPRDSAKVTARFELLYGQPVYRDGRIAVFERRSTDRVERGANGIAS